VHVLWKKFWIEDKTYHFLIVMCIISGNSKTIYTKVSQYNVHTWTYVCINLTLLTIWKITFNVNRLIQTKGRWWSWGIAQWLFSFSRIFKALGSITTTCKARFWLSLYLWINISSFQVTLKVINDWRDFHTLGKCKKHPHQMSMEIEANVGMNPALSRVSNKEFQI
jgi:hypothetical protein